MRRGSNKYYSIVEKILDTYHKVNHMKLKIKMKKKVSPVDIKLKNKIINKNKYYML